MRGNRMNTVINVLLILVQLPVSILVGYRVKIISSYKDNMRYSEYLLDILDYNGEKLFSLGTEISGKQYKDKMIDDILIEYRINDSGQVKSIT